MFSRRSAKVRRFERLEVRCLLSVGDPYVVPTNPRVTQNLDAAWKFQLNPTGSPQSSGYDDSTWSSINLPYTWDGSTTNASLGNGWYRKTITIDPSLIGKELYLEFGGAYLVTSLFIDGTQADYNPTVAGIDSHNGGFAEFDFDVTAQLTAETHLIAVQVNNNTNSNIEPAGGGDYTKQGGIYRDASLVAINKAAHLAPIESAPGTNTPVATPGVYFSNSNVTIGIATANIQVVSELDNLSASASSITITSYLVDAAGIIQAQTTSTQSLAAGQRSVAVTQSASVANPHLWDGRIDPYLYTLFDEVRDSGTNALLDLSQQQVGIRSFKINAQPNTTDADPTNDAAFMLNGHPYQLVGVNVHQDTGEPGQLGVPAGWAETDAEVQNDINLVLQTGATLVRTAHYEHSQAQFSYFDQVGLLVIAEGGINGTITSTTPGSAFVNNADDQLTELIKQNYNHPSIFAWSLYNEVSNSAAKGSLMSSLSSLAHSLDATGRYTDAENNSGSITDAVDAAADINGQHLYSGWYGGSPTQNGSQLDSMHNSSPTRPLGVTEFGGGASPWQFTNNIQLSPPNPNGEHFHPANSQTQLEELMYAQWASHNYLWGIALWTMFDFSSSGRNEGDTQGQNDKGLITRDRQTKKDSFYFYQANWNDPSRSWANQRVLHISDHNWTDRTTPAAAVSVFSNLGAPALQVNGTLLGTMIPLVISGITIPHAFTIPSNVSLAPGANNIQAVVVYNGQTYSDSVTWSYHAAALGGTAWARVDFTDSSANLQAGYVADTGQAFNGTLGWVDSTTFSPAANAQGTYNRTTTTTAPFDQLKNRTGILLPTNRIWEYALPNGTYDIHLVAADSTNPNAVNNLLVQNIAVHDLDSTDFGDNGFDEFYVMVTVTNGHLTVAAAPGSVAPRLADIDINAIDNAPPSIVGSNFQYAAPEQLQLKFNVDVSASLTASDLQLVNQTTGQTIDPSNIAVSYATSSNTAIFTFPGFAAGMLPVGNYQMAIASGNVMNSVGAPLMNNFNVVIVQLVGDWDLNGQQTAADIPAAMNALVDLNSYRTVHNLTTAQLLVLGDVNDDAHIDNTDLSALLQLLIHGSGSGQVTGEAKPGAARNATIATGAKTVAPIIVEHADHTTEHRFGAFGTNSQVVQVPNWLSDLPRASRKVKMVAIVQDLNIEERTPTFRLYKKSATSERRRPVYRNSVDEAFASENLLDDSPQSKTPSAR